MGDIEQRQVRLKSDTRGPKNMRESEQREMVQLWGRASRERWCNYGGQREMEQLWGAERDGATMRESEQREMVQLWGGPHNFGCLEMRKSRKGRVGIYNGYRPYSMQSGC